MGTLKPLLPYGAGSVLQSVVRSLKASPVDEVRVILGHRSEELAAHLAGEGVETIRNPRYLEGMLTSVQAGIASAPPETEWLVIALGDQPSLRPETVRLLLTEARAGTESILVPSYGGRRGHPLLIHAGHREEIATLGGETGLRELLIRHPEAVRHVPVPDDAVLHDMDTPDDYQRELERLEAI
jgi:molybdenum cofactor cytidylyltransferase